VVTVEVFALQRRELVAAVDVATSYRAAVFGVVVLYYGHRVAGGVFAAFGFEFVGSLVATPHIVGAAAVLRLQVDFSAVALPHIGDEQIAGLTVKTKSPGVAQSKRPDFRLAAVFRVWVIIRNRVRVAAVNVQP